LFGGWPIHLAVIIQWNDPLTLALSPSDGERECLRLSNKPSLFGDDSRHLPSFSLAPFDGERAEGRGFWTDCIIPAQMASLTFDVR
jgi:hypothetical protein